MKRTQLKQFAVCLLTTVLSISCTGELSIEVQEWIAFSDEEIELDIKDNSKTVTISSKGGWTATSDVDWLVIEPSKGSTGETEVTITSMFEENKEATGTISFNSSQVGNLKEKQLTITFNSVLPTSISDKNIELSIKNSATTTITTLFEWKIESYPEWLTITPAQGTGTTELLIESARRYDFNAAGEIVIVDEVREKITINVSQIKYFDDKFAQILQEKGYSRDASKIDLDIVKEIKKLEIRDAGLTNLTGIEFFKSLTELYCNTNQLTSLDVSKNTSLTSLQCWRNQLTSLDVSKNTALKYLGCGGNQLTSLDVSKNTSLTSLDCGANQLTSLDVSKNAALIYLYCGANLLKNLDISKNTDLSVLVCRSNPGTDGYRFRIRAWFENYSIPKSLAIHDKSWDYNGNTITIDFYK